MRRKNALIFVNGLEQGLAHIGIIVLISHLPKLVFSQKWGGANFIPLCCFTITMRMYYDQEGKKEGRDGGRVRRREGAPNTI